jgi:glycyl-tRNA synthetase
VIETSVGADRTTLAVLVNAYREETVEGEDEGRTVLRLHPSLAPIKVAVFPLLRKDGHPELAREVYEGLRTRMTAEYDAGGHIGKRYRRQDEIGTPFAVTIDHQSVEDHTVTLRQRDTLQQDRIAIDRLAGELEERIR